MQDILNNAAIQTAVVLVIVTALNALVAFINQKFPTQSALVEKNWCYIQPAVETAIAKAQEATRNRESTAVLSAIISESVTMFADKYELLEGKKASLAEINAARSEIAKAVDSVKG